MGVLIMSALLFGVFIGAPDFEKLPHLRYRILSIGKKGP